jgi:hypothetical protein
MRALAAAACALTLAGGALATPGQGAVNPTTPEAFPYLLTRPVIARVLHTKIWVARNANSRSIGRSLASLRPSWVSGTFRYARGQQIDRPEVRAWNEITRIVRATNPRVRFDVVLNATQYHSGQQLLNMMNRIRRKLNPDGWFFDFYSTAYQRRPKVIEKAIADAHARQEFIGGNIFGVNRRRPLPMRSDFLSVQDFNLRLNGDAVRAIASQIPTTYHLHSHPDRVGVGGCRFIQRYNSTKRRKHIRRRATQQLGIGYRFQYPVLFPQCKKQGGTGQRLYAYNAFRDPPVMRTIRRQLDRYDGA